MDIFSIIVVSWLISATAGFLIDGGSGAIYVGSGEFSGTSMMLIPQSTSA